jgi:L-2,4-diaminobutyrate decarboxylase
MKNIFEQAYDHESFREQGYQLVDLLADYLKKATSRDYDKVLPNTSPQDQLAKWDTTDSGKNLNAFFQKVLANSTKLQHPKYMGHQVSPTLPVAALADLFSALLNNGTG